MGADPVAGTGLWALAEGPVSLTASMSAPRDWWQVAGAGICLTFVVVALIIGRRWRRRLTGPLSGVEPQGTAPAEPGPNGANGHPAGRRSAMSRTVPWPADGPRAIRPALPWPDGTTGARSGNGASGCRAAGRLRILVITSEAPPIVSGISRSVDRLTTGLRARGHHVDVLSSVQVPRLVLGEVRLSSLAAFWPAVARRLRDYDVVNLHGPVPTMSDVFLLLSRLMRRLPCPIVYTHHSALQIKGAERLCGLYDRMHGALSARVALTVTTSRYYADLLGAAVGRPVWVVPWGVDVRPERLRRRGGLRPLRVLFVGQMRAYKGVETLLPAVAGCHEIELVLVGDGDHLNHYRLLAGDLGATNVQFLGRVGDDELLEVYDRSDVIVLPSLTRAEAFGLVALEGMAAGCVPVVSDLPGVRDLVSRTGVVVPPGDVARLRAALLELAHSRPRLEQLSRAARRRAEGLGWDACVTRYEQALLAAVGAWQDGRETPVPPPDEQDAPSGPPGRPVPHQAAGPSPAASRRAPGARPQPAPSMNGQVRSRGRSG